MCALQLLCVERHFVWTTASYFENKPLMYQQIWDPFWNTVEYQHMAVVCIHYFCSSSCKGSKRNVINVPHILRYNYWHNKYCINLQIPTIHMGGKQCTPHAKSRLYVWENINSVIIYTPTLQDRQSHSISHIITRLSASDTCGSPSSSQMIFHLIFNVTKFNVLRVGVIFVSYTHQTFICLRSTCISPHSLEA